LNCRRESLGDVEIVVFFDCLCKSMLGMISIQSSCTYVVVLSPEPVLISVLIPVEPLSRRLLVLAQVPTLGSLHLNLGFQVSCLTQGLKRVLRSGNCSDPPLGPQTLTGRLRQIVAWAGDPRPSRSVFRSRIVLASVRSFKFIQLVTTMGSLPGFSYRAIPSWVSSRGLVTSDQSRRLMCFVVMELGLRLAEPSIVPAWAGGRRFLLTSHPPMIVYWAIPARTPWHAVEVVPTCLTVVPLAV